MIVLAIVMFVLTCGAAFVGFRDLLPGVLTLLMKLLFALFGLIFIIALNVLALRKRGDAEGSARTDRPAGD